MMITFEFHEQQKQELKNFVDPTRSHYGLYVALLKQLGVAQQRWYYYTPKVTAPPGFGHKLVIWFAPDDACVWSNFLKMANDPNASQAVQDALRTLPVGTSSGPDFRSVWPDKTIYDCEMLFTY
jgi:hypothetical protein